MKNSSLPKEAEDFIRMLYEQSSGTDFGQRMVKFMNARKDESTKVKDFSLVSEMGQENLKVLRDSYLHFSLKR